MRKHENGLFGQFAQETLQGIFKASHALGYSITFTFADRDAPCEQLIAMVHGKDCDGLILYQVSDAALIARLRQEQIPFVCVDAHLAQDGSLPLVEVDYYNAARQATQYLCQCGHREIGFIGTQVPNTYYMNTFGGYMDALKAFGLEYNVFLRRRRVRHPGDACRKGARAEDPGRCVIHESGRPARLALPRPAAEHDDVRQRAPRRVGDGDAV